MEHASGMQGVEANAKSRTPRQKLKASSQALKVHELHGGHSTRSGGAAFSLASQN